MLPYITTRPVALTSHAPRRRLFGCASLLKVAGANWRTSSTAAYSHPEQPDHVFLTFSLLSTSSPPSSPSSSTSSTSSTSSPSARSARGSVLQVHKIPASQPFQTAPHGTFPWHLLFTPYTSDFRFPHVLDFLFGASSPVGGIKLSSEDSREFVGSSAAGRTRGAGFDFRRSKKPLTCVTLHSETVTMMQTGARLWQLEENVREWWHASWRAEGACVPQTARVLINKLFLSFIVPYCLQGSLCEENMCRGCRLLLHAPCLNWYFLFLMYYYIFFVSHHIIVTAEIPTHGCHGGFVLLFQIWH